METSRKEVVGAKRQAFGNARIEHRDLSGGKTSTYKQQEASGESRKQDFGKRKLEA